MTKLNVKDMIMIDGSNIECNRNICLNGERIFFTEEMLENNIIIVDTSHQIELEDGILMSYQSVEILYANDLYSQQILLYHGPELKEIFDNLLKKEIVTQFMENTFQNFILNMVALSESNMTSVDLWDYHESIVVKEIITNKINTIKEYLIN